METKNSKREQKYQKKTFFYSIESKNTFHCRLRDNEVYCLPLAYRAFDLDKSQKYYVLLKFQLCAKRSTNHVNNTQTSCALSNESPN